MTNRQLSDTQIFLNQIPAPATAILVRLLELPLINQPDELLRQLNDSKAKFGAILKHNEFFDIDNALQMYEVLSNLLETWNKLSEDHQPLLGAATLYFIKVDDAESDANSILGLEDDIQVVNAMLEIIGRTDLQLNL